MSDDVARLIAHLIVLLWCMYLALDERALGHRWQAWLWGALAIERFSILVLLAIDVWSSDGTLWLEYRRSLAPFIVGLAAVLSVYCVSRIMEHRKIRRSIGKLSGDKESYPREAASW